MYKKRVTSGLRCCELVKDRINENFRHRENFAPQANFGCGRRRQKLSKFSIAICKNCVGKMLIIMELLLNNYLGHFSIIEKTFGFSFHGKCNKANQGHQSPLQRVDSRSFPSAIYTSPMGGRALMLGQINLQFMKHLRCSKRLTGDYAIMNLYFLNSNTLFLIRTG